MDFINKPVLFRKGRPFYKGFMDGRQVFPVIHPEYSDYVTFENSGLWFAKTGSTLDNLSAVRAMETYKLPNNSLVQAPVHITVTPEKHIEWKAPVQSIVGTGEAFLGAYEGDSDVPAMNTLSAFCYPISGGGIPRINPASTNGAVTDLYSVIPFKRGIGTNKIRFTMGDDMIFGWIDDAQGRAVRAKGVTTSARTAPYYDKFPSQEYTIDENEKLEIYNSHTVFNNEDASALNCFGAEWASNGAYGNSGINHYIVPPAGYEYDYYTYSGGSFEGTPFNTLCSIANKANPLIWTFKFHYLKVVNDTTNEIEEYWVPAYYPFADRWMIYDKISHRYATILLDTSSANRFIPQTTGTPDA